MTPRELFKAGNLAEAIAAATEEVKRHPADNVAPRISVRIALLRRRFATRRRALGRLGQPGPASRRWAFQLFRQLLRAEQARQHFYKEGRCPSSSTRPNRT